jgi:sugar phosphate isomerase/epimerase
MFKLGVCAPVSQIDLAAAAGFGFIEPPLNALAVLSDDEFAAVKRQVTAAPIRAWAFNCMMPGDLKITGPAVDRDALCDYLDAVFPRAEQLGAEIIVFGSGGARGVPDGFPMGSAWLQIMDFLRLCEPIATAHGIVIAIEPLRRAECNIINYVSEAVALAALIDSPHIGALGDTHHMNCGHEPIEALAFAGGLLKHVHVSHSLGNAGRVFPALNDGEDYKALFDVLNNSGYRGKISVEASCEDFALDGARAAEALIDGMRD